MQVCVAQLLVISETAPPQPDNKRLSLAQVIYLHWFEDGVDSDSIADVCVRFHS